MQTWPSPGNPGAPTYYADTESIAKFDNPGVDYDHIIAGTYHNSTGAGKVTFIGGHSFATSLPYSTNAEAPYLRAFYNSLFFNGSAVAKLDMKLLAGELPAERHRPPQRERRERRREQGHRARLGDADDAARLHLRLDDHRPGADVGDRQPATTGQTLTWSSLGDIDGGQTAVTVSVSVDSSLTSTLGNKQFGQFHILYGDEFGEGFTADLCRDVTIVPQPGAEADEDAVLAGAGLDGPDSELDARLRQHRRCRAQQRPRAGHAAGRFRLRLELLVAVDRADRHPGLADDPALERRSDPGEHAVRRDDHRHRARGRGHQRQRAARRSRRSRTTRSCAAPTRAGRSTRRRRPRT